MSLTPTLSLCAGEGPPESGLGSVLVFRRRDETATATSTGKSAGGPSTTSSTNENPANGSGAKYSEAKGRPTPSRKDAEAARKSALRTPSDPKAARKQSRERERTARIEARQAMASGDTRKLPPRDSGPVRMFVRDYVDSRRSVAEFFIPFAFMVIVLGFFKQPALQAILVLSWMLMFLLLVVDSFIIGYRLKTKLAQQWPDKADRRGTLIYALMRTLQIRRMRLPPPRFKAGGKPVTPKAR